MRTAILCGALVGVCLQMSSPAKASVWINEFHYDNDGADTGEFVEVVVGPHVPAVDPNDVTVTFYNGINGEVYESANLGAFTAGDFVDGFQFYHLSLAGIQNGSPDGIALDDNGTLLEFISYEGSFSAVEGPATGIVSIDIGVDEPSSTPAGQSLQLTGVGTSAADFLWAGPLAETPGSLNAGQSFPAEPGPGAGVPEPASVWLWLCWLAIACTRTRGNRRVRLQN